MDTEPVMRFDGAMIVARREMNKLSFINLDFDPEFYPKAGYGRGRGGIIVGYFPKKACVASILITEEGGIANASIEICGQLKEGDFKGNGYAGPRLKTKSEKPGPGSSDSPEGGFNISCRPELQDVGKDLGDIFKFLSDLINDDIDKFDSRFRSKPFIGNLAISESDPRSFMDGILGGMPEEIYSFNSKSSVIAASSGPVCD